MEIVKIDLENAAIWSTKNNMSLNEFKFVYLRYGNKKPNNLAELPFNTDLVSYQTPTGHTLEPSQNTRDLGVVMCSQYTWDLHIGEMIEKAQDMASWTLSVFRDRSMEVMTTLLKSFVRSRLEFCSPLWSPMDIGNIERIEGVQRSFIRRISGLNADNYWDRLQTLGLMSLQRRRERYTIIHIWKILHQHAPNDLDIRFYNTERRGTKITIPSMNRDASCAARRAYDSSFAVRGGQLWNLLPKDVNCAKTLPSFKRLLGKFLDQFPDKPPVNGYSRQNSNSLTDWISTGGLQEERRPC